MNFGNGTVTVGKSKHPQTLKEMVIRGSIPLVLKWLMIVLVVSLCCLVAEEQPTPKPGNGMAQAGPNAWTKALSTLERLKLGSGQRWRLTPRGA